MAQRAFARMPTLANLRSFSLDGGELLLDSFKVFQSSLRDLKLFAIYLPTFVDDSETVSIWDTIAQSPSIQSIQISNCSGSYLNAACLLRLLTDGRFASLGHFIVNRIFDISGFEADGEVYMAWIASGLDYVLSKYEQFGLPTLELTQNGLPTTPSEAYYNWVSSQTAAIRVTLWEQGVHCGEESDFFHPAHAEWAGRTVFSLSARWRGLGADTCKDRASVTVPIGACLRHLCSSVSISRFNIQPPCKYYNISHLCFNTSLLPHDVDRPISALSANAVHPPISSRRTPDRLAAKLANA